MAISNFKTLSKVEFDRLQDYDIIAPVVGGSGTQNSSLNTFLYVNDSDNKLFAMQIGATGQDLSLSVDSSVADQLNLVCTTNAANHTPLYASFREDQGWTESLNMSISLTNVDASKGKMTFTKGKSDKPRPPR